MEPWTAGSVQIDDGVHVDVKANDQGVVLGQGNSVWFHDVHLTPDQAIEIASALYRGAVYAIRAAKEAK